MSVPIEDLLGNMIVRDGDLLDVTGGEYLTSDPASPVNGTWWVKVTGAGPYEISLNVRIAGTTHSIPLYTTA